VARKDIRRISTNGKCIYFDPDWLQKLTPTALDYILAHQLMHIILEHVDRPPLYRGDRFHLACDIVANALLRELGWQYDRLSGIGRIYCYTFFPSRSGCDLSAYEALSGVPFDPALLPESKRRSYLIDSEQAWEDKADRGESGTIVLSPGDPEPPDLDDENIDLGTAHLYIIKQYTKRRLPMPIQDPSPGKTKTESAPQVKNRITNIRNRTQADRHPGRPTESSERQWLYRPIQGPDWRALTRLFLTEDLHDYSFTPPDPRMQESEFFLPSYTVTQESIKNLLIMIDTSGSVDAPMLDMVYSHLISLLRSLDYAVEGHVGFFDTRVYGPYPLDGGINLHALRPLGGGGTDIDCVFRHIQNYDGLSGLIVFTDGAFDFPPPPRSLDLPVLWLLTKPANPPWGTYAQIQ
jgi:predicted metal-dependent peptidase